MLQRACTGRGLAPVVHTAQRPPLRWSHLGKRPALHRPRAKAPWERSGADDQPPRLSQEEGSKFCAEQLAFLDRKRRGMMPQGSVCGSCEGSGILVCHRCGGSGINAEQVDAELFEGEVYQRNGLLNVENLFQKGWPCWLCRGRKEIGCPDCRGAGFKGASELYSGD